MGKHSSSDLQGEASLVKASQEHVAEVDGPEAVGDLLEADPFLFEGLAEETTCFLKPEQPALLTSRVLGFRRSRYSRIFHWAPARVGQPDVDDRLLDIELRAPRATLRPPGPVFHPWPALFIDSPQPLVAGLAADAEAITELRHRPGAAAEGLDKLISARPWAPSSSKAWPHLRCGHASRCYPSPRFTL